MLIKNKLNWKQSLSKEKQHFYKQKSSAKKGVNLATSNQNSQNIWQMQSLGMETKGLLLFTNLCEVCI